MTKYGLMTLSSLFVLLFSANTFAGTGADSLAVVEFILCEAVEEREPVNPADSFSTDMERVYAFARVSNPGDPVELFFLWTHNEAEYARISVKVGTSPAWRTYSTVLALEGEWKVELIDESGEALSSAEFIVTAVVQ